MDWILFIFNLNGKFYLVNADCEDDAWNRLQKRLSWRMEIVKERCKLMDYMNGNSEIKCLKS